MTIDPYPFEIIDWTKITEEKHTGESGIATWQVIHLGNIRVRKVSYSPGYSADHWCKKGHIIHCLEGEMITQLEDGRSMYLKKGQTYLVGDNSEAHKTSTADGCVLFIVD